MNVRSFVISFTLSCFNPLLAQHQTVIKMGTLAPEGSPWHQVLQRMGERWRNISGGAVRLNIYAGGNLGDEPDLVNKMRIGQIQAVALSGAGMERIEPGVSCLQIPMMFRSYEELDYVRDHLAPRLESMIDARGFIVLNWGDAGWVHFFTRRPVRQIGEMRRMSLFVWAGFNNDELELWKTAGFRPQPLAATDILPSLQTGLIDAVPLPPLYALLDQVFGIAKYMNDIKWSPLVGTTVIAKPAWEKLPAGQRAEMLAAAREAGDELRQSIRKMGDDAVTAMRNRNLVVSHADAADEEEWRRETESMYPRIRGKIVPADLFDEVLRLRDQYRSGANARVK